MRGYSSLGRVQKLLTLALGIGIAVSASRASAQLNGPRGQDRLLTQVVHKLLKSEHLSKRPIDDEISQRGYHEFLKSLDPMKLYFYQSDIDEFDKKKFELDDMFAKYDISFAYQVFDVFLKRVDERLAMVKQILAMNHDFTVEEDVLVDPKVTRYPRDQQEAFERWRRRIKYDLLVLKGDKTEGQEAKDKLTRRYQTFAKRMHQYNGDELLENYVTALTSTMDPHTNFMSPSSFENFQIIMRLNLDGIGAALQSTDGYTVVSKVIPGGAADKHGKLKPDDRIVSVSNEQGQMVDVVDMKLNDVVHMIRGKAGTNVKLGVMPGGKGETQIYEITRAKIELKDSEARKEIFKEGKDASGNPLKLAVIDLPSFYMDMDGAKRGVADFKSTTRDVRRLLEDCKKEQVDAVILDLRKNGGGSLTEAINLTGLFIDQGPVVQVKDADGRVQVYEDMDRGVAWDGPLVVLTSKFSASASEIFAGAIQDYQRGLVVGDETTHGKGTVQTLLDLGQVIFKVPNPPNRGALKVTIQQFYRPNGDSTQRRGVLADLVLPSITNHMDVSEGDLEYSLPFDRVQPAKFSAYKMCGTDLVTSLRGLSAERRKKSEEFDKLLKNIERYLGQKSKKSVSLNEKVFFAQRAEVDAEKLDEKALQDQDNGNEVVKRDFYFNEVLSVTEDYVRLLGANRIARK